MDIIYNEFAKVYDKLMSDVNYNKIADYIQKVFEKFSCCPQQIVDLGCGTGSFCIEMASRGYKMIGIDISPEMLECAVKKSDERRLDIFYINQNMANFDLLGMVDAFTCLTDSLNYITCKKDLLKVFKNIYSYLNPGGLFIFDINTIYKHSKILGNEVFYEIRDDVTYIWQNRYCEKRKISEYDLTFFVEKSPGLYVRFDEYQRQRAYSIEEIKDLLEKVGFYTEGIFDFLSFNRPRKKSEKIFFVVSKKM